MFVRQRIAPAGLPKAVLLSAFERMSPGEAMLFREIAAAPGHAFEKFMHLMPATMHRHAAPADLFHMARIGATLIEDCGPCALTAAHAALKEGVDREVVNLALAAKLSDGQLKTAFDFGQAIALHAANALDLGQAIEVGSGRSTRLELAMTAASVRTYPAMKRGLGLGKACALMPMSV